MNFLRNKTVCEIHLIFYLILTVILCTSIVSYVYYQNNQLKQKCNNECPKTDNRNTSKTHSGVVKDKNQRYADLNYQPFINDQKINSLVIKSTNSIELMRNTLNIPCVLVGISINGTDLWAQGMGYSDVENGVKCHKHSAFSLGPMSEPMISLLIASLIDSKKLNLDKNIEDMDFNESYSQVSNFSQESNSSHKLTLRELMLEKPFLRKEKSDTAHLYCNKHMNIFEEPFSVEKLRFYESSIYWKVITERIESVQNLPFPSALNNFLSTKMYLLMTGVESNHSIVPYIVNYYYKNSSSLQNYGSDNEIPVNCWPSFSIISTIKELLMFGRKVIDVYNGNLDSTINSSTFRQFISRQTQHLQHPTNHDIYYGLGWMLFDDIYTNETQVSHFFGYSGQTSGTSYLFMVRPDDDFVITLFANLGGVENELNKLARQMVNDFKHI